MLWRGPMGGGAASGRIGAMIASHCAQGQYLKSRVQNTNPRTTLQHPTRNALRQLASMWGQTLTSTQRTGWATYAANTTWVNRLGDTVHLSGQMEFTRSNWLRQYIHLPYVLDAPTTFDRGSTGPGTLTVTAGDDFGVLNIDPAAMWQDGSSLTACMVFMGIPRSGARTFMAKRTQLSATLLGTFGSGTAFPRLVPITTVAAYDQAFPCWLVASFSDGRLTTATPIAAAFTGPPPPPFYDELFPYADGPLPGNDGWTQSGGFGDVLQIVSQQCIIPANTTPGADTDDALLLADSDPPTTFRITFSRTLGDDNDVELLVFPWGTLLTSWTLHIHWTPGDAALDRVQLQLEDQVGIILNLPNVPMTTADPHTIAVDYDGINATLSLDGGSLGSAAATSVGPYNHLSLAANNNPSTAVITVTELQMQPD